MTDNIAQEIARVSHYPLPRNLTAEQIKALEPQFARFAQMTEENQHISVCYEIAVMFGHSAGIAVFSALKLLRSAEGETTPPMREIYDKHRIRLRQWVFSRYPEVYDRIHYST